MGRTTAITRQYSSSSSIDSSNHPHPQPHSPLLSTASSSASLCHIPNKIISRKRNLSIDLRLGLSFSPPSTTSSTSNQREPRLDWPPINKPLLRSRLAGNAENGQSACLFVKVYMEGLPIGRKLDLFAHQGYNALITTLSQMFRANILYPDADPVSSEKQYHVLTYEDKEGDWMMVGDVPWEMFLASVKRLKITRADRC